jgi:hypothetical protein
VSDVKKQCQTCQWYQIGEFNTMGAGRVKIRVCTNPLSPSSQTISGPLASCEQWAYDRQGGTRRGS